jgi:hypothetical protein
LRGAAERISAAEEGDERCEHQDNEQKEKFWLRREPEYFLAQQAREQDAHGVADSATDKGYQ